jgi:hypothetical protein
MNNMTIMTTKPAFEEQAPTAHEKSPIEMGLGLNHT